MKKICPICKRPYQRTWWTDTKAGGYRQWRHEQVKTGFVDYCGGAIGVRYAQVLTLSRKRRKIST